MVNEEIQKERKKEMVYLCVSVRVCMFVCVCVSVWRESVLLCERERERERAET